MATVTTDIVPTPAVFPYIGRVLEDQEAPRAEVWFHVLGSSIPAAGAGDDRRCNITCHLPPNFAYALADCSLLVQMGTNDVSNSWENDANLVLSNTINDTGRTQKLHYRLTSGSSSSTLKLQGSKAIRAYMFQATLPPTLVLRTPPGLGASNNCTGTFQLSNDTASSAESFVDAFLRFYQYDINQQFHQAVNSPTLIR